MKKIVLLVLSSLLLFVMGCTDSQPSLKEKRKEAVKEYLKFYETGNDSIKELILQQYPKFQETFLGDVSSILPEIQGHCNFEIVRMIADDSVVFVQSLVRSTVPPQNFVAIDYFVFASDGILKHWTMMSRCDDSDPDATIELGGETKITDLKKTEENKKLVTDFARLLYVEYKHSTLPNFFDNGKLLQHHPTLKNTFHAYMEEVQPMPYNPTDSDEIPLKINVNPLPAVAEGNFVLVAHILTYELVYHPYDFYAFELFRVENGKIVELWDSYFVDFLEELSDEYIEDEVEGRFEEE